MSHYNANLRDIEFCLFDLLGREKVLGNSIYSELDRDTAMGMLDEMKRLTKMISLHLLLTAIVLEQISIKQLAK